MRWRWAWFATAVLTAVVAMGVFAGFLISSAPWLDDALFLFAGFTATVVGALLAARRPENPIGRLLVLIGSSWLIGESSRIYLWTSLYQDLPMTGLATWLVLQTAVLGWALIPVLLIVFPSGRVASSWLRWPLRIYLSFLAILLFGSMFGPGDLGEGFGDYLAGFTNPLAIDALTALDGTAVGSYVIALFDLSGLIVVVVGLAAFGDLVLRWRRSGGVVRLQMRAFALGALVMILFLVLGAALLAVGVENRIFENLTTTIAISAPSVAVGVAVLRYRLYEIDRLISRTVSYALVVAVLAGVFAAIAIGIPQFLDLPTDSPLLVAGATLAVAGLFTPLRRRVQSTVDRRFNRTRYDAQQAVDRLTERLRGEVQLDDLTDELVSVVDKTMQPVSATVWIRGNV